MKKQTKGILLLIVGLVIYLAYWLVLLYPVQIAYSGTRTYPSIVLCLLAAIVVSAIAWTLVYTGTAMIKDKAFGIRHTEFSFKQLFASTAWRAMLIILAGITIGATIHWRGEL